MSRTLSNAELADHPLAVWIETEVSSPLQHHMLTNHRSPRELQHEWEERGYTFVRFAADTSTWPPTFKRLARMLPVPEVSA